MKKSRQLTADAVKLLRSICEHNKKRRKAKARGVKLEANAAV